MDYLPVMQMLNTCHGPAGDEHQIAAALQRLAEPYADECRRDAMGNLIVHKKGPGPKVMFAAHMDSIGLIVTHIEEDGFLRFGKLGGVHPASILHTPFRFKNGVCGVVTLGQKTAVKDMTLEDLYLDIGVTSAKEAERLVKPGDTAVSFLPVLSAESRLIAPYLDNRISCVALLDAMGRIKLPQNDLYFVFTVQEELGLRGSKTAAYAIDPDYAIAVDVTAADEPDSTHQGNSKLGGGAAVKVMDHSVICHPKMVEYLCTLALERKIPFQKDILTSGGTDAGSMQMSRGGVRTGGISIPCRYLHSPSEMIDCEDVAACADLLVAFAEKKLEN